MTQPTSHHDTAILIVTYNSAAALAPCLASAARTGAYVLVIDNASHDGSGKLAEDLGFPVIANATNRGFAAAVNQGCARYKRPFPVTFEPGRSFTNGNRRTHRTVRYGRRGCRRRTIALTGRRFSARLYRTAFPVACGIAAGSFDHQSRLAPQSGQLAIPLLRLRFGQASPSGTTRGSFSPFSTRRLGSHRRVRRRLFPGLVRGR